MGPLKWKGDFIASSTMVVSETRLGSSLACGQVVPKVNRLSQIRLWLLRQCTTS